MRKRQLKKLCKEATIISNLQEAYIVLRNGIKIKLCTSRYVFKVIKMCGFTINPIQILKLKGFKAVIK